MDRFKYVEQARALVEQAVEDEEGVPLSDLLRALVYAVLAVAERMGSIEEVACALDDLRREL